MTCGTTTEPHGPEKEPHRSLPKDALGLGIQRLPLRGLAVHGAEANDVQLLSRLLHGVHPFLQRACCELLLCGSRLRLAHNPTRLVLDQLLLGHTAARLLLPTPEHNSTSVFAPGHLARLHGLLRRSFHGQCHCFERPREPCADKSGWLKKW